MYNESETEVQNVLRAFKNEQGGGAGKQCLPNILDRNHLGSLLHHRAFQALPLEILTQWVWDKACKLRLLLAPQVSGFYLQRSKGNVDLRVRGRWHKGDPGGCSGDQVVPTPSTETHPSRAHPSSEARMALSCTLPLQEAAVRALPTPFHSPLEDKEPGDKKKGEKGTEGFSLFP